MPPTLRLPGGPPALALALVLQAALGATAASAQDSPEPTVLDIRLERGPTPALSFRGEHLIDAKVRSALENGARAKVYFWIEIDRARTLWFDESIVDTSLYHRLRYDRATRQWLVRTGSGKGPLLPVASFDEALRMLSSVRLELPGPALDPEERYEVRVRIECHSIAEGLALGLHRILPFQPERGFDTGWVVRSIP